MSIDPLNRWEGNIHHQEVTYLGRGHTEISPPDVFLFEHISSVLRDQRMNRKPGRGGEEWLGKASLGRQSVELMDGGGGALGACGRVLGVTGMLTWQISCAGAARGSTGCSRPRAAIGMVSILISKENILDPPALRRRIWGLQSFPFQTSITAPSLSSVILGCGCP